MLGLLIDFYSIVFQNCFLFDIMDRLLAKNYCFDCRSMDSYSLVVISPEVLPVIWVVHFSGASKETISFSHGSKQIFGQPGRVFTSR